MPVNNATNNFALTHLAGSDTAGHNSINYLITDIDTRLYERVAVPGMIMLFLGGAAPEGWEELLDSPATTPTLTEMNDAFLNPGESLPPNTMWIKKKV